MKKRKKKTVVTTGKLRKFRRLSSEAASLIELGRVHEKLNKISEDITQVKERMEKQNLAMKEVQSMIDLVLASKTQEEAEIKTRKRELVDIDLKILDILESHGPMSAKDLAQKCGFNDRSSFQKRYLKPMVERKILDSIKRGRRILYRMSEAK